MSEKIAVLSDTHDQIPHLRAAVSVCLKRQIGMIVHCGDLISPFMLPELARFSGPVHLVYGNNAGDRHLISQWCGTRFPAITLHGHLAEIEAAGRRLAVHHYPELARGLACLGRYDLVCCGHNHRYGVEWLGDTLLVNPGELLGKEGQPTFCIVDCPTMTVERVSVGAPLFS